jgi:hypothetical protein
MPSWTSRNGSRRPRWSAPRLDVRPPRADAGIPAPTTPRPPAPSTYPQRPPRAPAIHTASVSESDSVAMSRYPDAVIMSFRHPRTPHHLEVDQATLSSSRRSSTSHPGTSTTEGSRNNSPGTFGSGPGRPADARAPAVTHACSPTPPSTRPPSTMTIHHRHRGNVPATHSPAGGIAASHQHHQSLAQRRRAPA